MDRAQSWHDGKVVGFVNFHPVNASFDNLCPHTDTTELRKELQNFRWQWPEKPDEKLRIVCVDVAPGFRRAGLGTKLVEALI